MQKPSYSTTKLVLWLSLAAAWATIFLLLIASVMGSQNAMTLVPVVLPTMVMLIAALLGIHRGFGSLDMRTIALQQPGGSPQ